MEIGEWVRAAREAKGWSQTQLGDAIGVSKANVSHWETAKHEPSFGQLLAIRDKTGHPLHDVGPAQDWPLPGISRERLASLDAVQLAAVQAGIEGILAAVGAITAPAAATVARKVSNAR